RRQWCGVVGRASADGDRARRVSRDVLRGPRRVLSAGRRHHDHARGAGLTGRRCRGPSRLRHELRRAGSRARADVLRRARPDIAGSRRRARLRDRDSVHLVVSALVTSSRGAAVALADKYRDPATFDRTVTLAWTHAQVQLHHLGVDPSEAHLFQDLAGRILYSDPTLRPSADTLKRNTSGAAALWPYGISGDLPIILVRIDEPED